jgi:hypothetical protein
VSSRKRSSLQRHRMLAKSAPHSVHFVRTRLDKRGIKTQALVVVSIQEGAVRVRVSKHILSI